MDANHKHLPRIYVGCVSKNVVDAVLEHPNSTKFGIIASRRQVDYNGGYVCGWNTEKASHYIKSRAPSVLFCRDHGGPLQGSHEDDGIESLRYDARYCDIIHIDPWKYSITSDTSLATTIDLMEKCVGFGFTGKFEVCTEAGIAPLTSYQINLFLESLSRINPSLFAMIAYVVVQFGTRLIANRNIGKYDPVRMRDDIELCQAFGVLSKEHNGDYQDDDIIAHKFANGLSAINVAPEFGMIESGIVISRLLDKPDLLDLFFRLCYNSGQWKKWVPMDFDPLSNKIETLRIAGHYVFSDPDFVDKIGCDKELNIAAKAAISSRLDQLLLSSENME